MNGGFAPPFRGAASRAEFAESTGVRHRQRHEVHGLEVAKAAVVVRFRFAEFLAGVEARVVGDDHGRRRRDSRLCFQHHRV